MLGGQAGAGFGASVATAGDVNGDGYSDAIVGAPGQGVLHVGQAYVYLGSAGGLATTTGWTAESDQASASFGASVATAGDVNGDGYSDVIVGAYSYDNGQFNEGRAFVYLGSAAGLATAPAWTAEGEQIGAAFGGWVANAGDVNGDGYSDVIIGALGYTNGQFSEGRAFVYLGSASGLAMTPAWTAEGDQADAFFASHVATAGDVNGDGYSDVIVGAGALSVETPQDAFVYLGSATGLATTAAWTADYVNSRVSVSTAGDVNGDGYSDVIVGVENYGLSGSAFAYLGSALGLATTPAWGVEGAQDFAQFGFSAATAGDVNGDGYSDVIVGQPGYVNGQSNEGRAYVYLGSASGLATTPAWTVESDQTNAGFGGHVAAAGDVNGDGYSDIIVGVPFYDNGQQDEGRAFVYLGSATGPATTPAWSAESDQEAAWLGASVATAGDVNGDGYTDVIVGAELYDNGQTDEGRAFVYYGNGGPGLSLKPQQRRSDDTRPIVHLGASDSQNDFRLVVLGRSPFGRSKVKLKKEVKPIGSLLDGTGTQTSPTWIDTGTAGAAVDELVSGLTSGMPYHWRLRLHYQAVSTPFQQTSRWFTVPWKGWQEWMLRTASATVGAGRVSDGSTGSPLILAKATLGQITLTWSASCLGTDTDYEIYEGTIGGNFTSHTSIFCSTGGATTKTFTGSIASTYYLVVPRNATREGSYGFKTGGIERPQGAAACLPQQIAACP